MPTHQPRFDLVLHGGVVIDGSVDPVPIRADVAVRDGRIVAIGDLREAARDAGETLDVSGRVVAPGFIDPHTHIEPALLAGRDDGAALLRQGITTVLLGADGFGWAPLAAGDARRLWAATAGIQGPIPDHLPTETVGAYLAAFDGAPVNVLPQVPHHAVRFAGAEWAGGQVAGDGLARMRRSVAAWLDAGATGLSVGLDYEPGSRADATEIETLCRDVARVGGTLSAHIRYTDLGRAAGWDEVVGIAERTGVRLVVAHERQDEVGMAALAAARSRVDVRFESYPYEAASTQLAAYLGRADRIGGPAAIAERLRDPAVARRIAAQLEVDIGAEIDLGDRFVVANAADSSRIGTDLAAAAASAGLDVGAYAVTILRDDPDALFVIHHDRADGPAITMRTLADPAALVASDGIYVPGRIHPRAHGTFPRVLRAAIDGALGVDLATAIHAMTGRTADAYRVPGRGRLVVGAVADVVRPGSGHRPRRGDLGRPARATRRDRARAPGRRVRAPRRRTCGHRPGPRPVRRVTRDLTRYALVMPIPEHLANRDLDVDAVLPASALPSQARVVIVGGGIIGSSIAYHLTRPASATW